MNIVIDGNAFLNVATSIVKNILEKNRSVGERYYVGDLTSDKYILKEASKVEFKRFSLNYLGSIIAPFKENIESVFIVFDSRSWRKQFIKQHIAIHGEAGDFEYKANRKYDEKQYLFFDYFQEELIPVLENTYGVITSKVHGAEGDDIIAYICETVHDDICIWTVDKDLIQLVESENRKIILVMPKMMTKFKKVYTTEKFDEIIEHEVDLFNIDTAIVNNSAVVNILTELLTKGYQHFRIDATKEILEKILAGDQSDSIPRLHSKLTQSKVKLIIEKVKETFDWSYVKKLIDKDDSRFTDFLVKIICESLKLRDQSDPKTIRSNYIRNRRLIRLNTEFLPDDIRESIENSIDLSDRRRFNYYQFKKNYYNF